MLRFNTLWKFNIFRYCHASHTKATEPRPTNFCHMLKGFSNLLYTIKFSWKFVPKNFRTQPSQNFRPTRFFATSALDITYLWNKTSHRQTKMQVSIYNVSLKVDLLSVTTDPETAEICWLIVTHHMKIQRFASLPVFPYKRYWTQANQILPDIKRA